MVLRGEKEQYVGNHQAVVRNKVPQSTRLFKGVGPDIVSSGACLLGQETKVLGLLPPSYPVDNSG